ncbi:MAG: Ig-like domain-containing protein [Casimicrobiaceae bacterium]
MSRWLCGLMTGFWVVLAGAAIPPQVRLLTPARMMTFVAPAAPVLAAIASYPTDPPPASILRVDFFDGDVLLGTVASTNAANGGYAFVWANAPIGPHAITARAIDSLGAVASSASVMLHVIAPREAPTVSLTAPASGTTMGSGTTVQLAASATSAQGTIQRVEFVAGEAVVATAFTPPFVATWVNPPPGEYAMTARAFDELGNAASSANARVQVLSAPRAAAVVLITPASGTAQIAGTPLILEASALGLDSAIQRVEFFNGSTQVGSANSAPFRYIWASPPVGTLTLRAKAYDGANSSAVSAPVSITSAPSTLPSVSLTSPGAGSVFISPDPIDLVATATRVGGAIGKVEFFDGATLIATRTSTPFAFAWSGAAVGTHTLTAKATDSLGASATSAPVSISVIANRKPTVALSSPPLGSVFVAGQSIPLAATASDPDGSVVKVEFLNGSTVLGASTTPPYSLAWTTAPAGSLTITARATDNRGATAVSAARTVQVVTDAAASVGIVAPSSHAAFAQGQPIVLKAIGTVPGRMLAQIEFYADSQMIGKVPFSGPSTATASLSWGGAAPGVHVLVARVVATDGTTASSTAVDIEVRDLAVRIFEPAVGQVYLAPGAVRITALAGETGHSITSVELLAGGQLLARLTEPPFAYDWSAVAPGRYTLTARVTDSTGLVATSTPTTISVVSVPAIAVDAGIDASTVGDDTVMVTGTAQAPANSAISVDGRRAIVDEQGRFFVNAVPLTTGANSLMLQLRLDDGTLVNQTLVVNSAGPGPFSVELDRVEGTAPFDTVLTITNRGKVLFSRIDVDVDDNGKPEKTIRSLVDGKVSIALSYGTTGVYVLRVTAYDAANKAIYVTRRKVHVYDPRALAARVASVYSTMLRNLASADIERAMAVITPTMRDAYRAIFARLGNTLPSAVQKLGAVSDITLGEDFADLLVVRPKADGTYGYRVLMIRDDDGVWRIDGM